MRSRERARERARAVERAVVRELNKQKKSPHFLFFLLSSSKHLKQKQEDFEAALESHRSLWLAEFERQKKEFEREFAQKKAALTSELEVKLGQRRAAKNMIVTLVFILRLLA